MKILRDNFVIFANLKKHFTLTKITLAGTKKVEKVVERGF